MLYEVITDHFASYASIPFFMLKKLDVPERQDQAIDYIANEFKVSRSYVEKRLKQIERRVIQSYNFV